eukprot:g5779.t1
MEGYQYTNSNHASIGAYGKHRTSPTVSPLKEYQRKQNFLYGTNLSHVSKTIPAATYCLRRQIRKQIHRQFIGVANDIHIRYLEHFDHDDGPERVDDQNFRYSKAQRETLSLMKRWVQRSFVRNVCVLVCQFDNLNKNATDYGIVHYNSVTVRTRQLCLPIFNKYKALYITTNLDSFSVIFDTPGQAACAAYDVKHVINAYKYSLEGSRSHFQARLKRIGIDMGGNIIIDAQGQIHGKPMHNAIKYVESPVTTPFQEAAILMSLSLVNKINGIPGFQNATFTPCQELECFELGGDIEYQNSVVPFSDMRFLNQNLHGFALRNQKGMDIEKLEKTIMLHFAKPTTVLQININAPNAFLDKFGLEYALIHRIETPKIIANCIQKYDVQVVSDDIYIFKSSAVAVECVKDMMDVLEKWNKQCKDERNVRQITAYGIDTSICIHVPNSDIYWGKAFDVANAIGTVNRNGEILISANVYSDLVDSGMFKSLRAIPTQINISPNTPASLYSIYFVNVEDEERGKMNLTSKKKSVRFDMGNHLTEQMELQKQKQQQQQSPMHNVAKRNIVKNVPISSLGAIIKSEGDCIGTDWTGIIKGRELERYSTANTIDSTYDPNKFQSSSMWVQKTMAERQREEYNRTKGGFGSIGNPNDVLIEQTSMRGKRYTDIARGNEKIVRPPQNRSTAQLVRPVDTEVILNLGSQPSPLKTRKLIKVKPHYDPVRQQYPSYSPHAPNAPNKEKTVAFERELKIRNRPIAVKGMHRKKTGLYSPKLQDPTKNDTSGDGVKSNLYNYGKIDPEIVSARSPRFIEQNAGNGIKELFVSYKDWSDNKLMEPLPMTRFDGSGREIIQKEHETYNRVFQRHMEKSAEDIAQQQEKQRALNTAQNNLDYQLQHENKYNLITLQDRKTGKIDNSYTRHKGVRIVKKLDQSTSGLNF